MNWVFIHGWGSDASVWQLLCEHLPGRHLFLELPGFGYASAENLTPDELIERWGEIIPNPCILVGWSLGGLIAARLAQANPHKITHLVSLASNPKFVRDSTWFNAMDVPIFTAFLDEFLQNPEGIWQRFCLLQIMGDKNRKKIYKFLQTQTPPKHQNNVAWLNALKWLADTDNREVLQALNIPQLHIFGKNDALVPVQCAKEMANLLANHQNLSFHILKDVGHVPHLSKPVDVAQLILHWLEPEITKLAIQRSFGRAAPIYDRFAKVQRKVAESLVALLPKIHKEANVVDLGCGTGFVAEFLKVTSDAEPILLDLALPMVRQAKVKLVQEKGLVADMEALPFPDNSVDYFISSLSLQWCHTLDVVFREAHRVLKPGGQFVFATLGPKTLYELKASWQNFDCYTHVNKFHDFTCVLQNLENSGFCLLKNQTFFHIENYETLMEMLRELKAIGAHNMNVGRAPGLTTAKQFKLLENQYKMYANETGQLPATYDLLFIQAEKP